MNRNKIVDQFVERLHHPLEKEINLLRELILGVDSKISEDVKWSSPTFTYKGCIASISTKSADFLTLVFHKGAFLHNDSGMLMGDDPEIRTCRFSTAADILSHKNNLKQVFQNWIYLQEYGPLTPKVGAHAA